jgi:hypothetical protein
MNRGEAALSLIKLTVASAGTVAVSSPFLQAFSTYIQLPVWGVPVTVIGAAGAGAILSLFFGDPLETRKQLFGQTIAATMFGSAIAVLVSDGLDWDWAIKNMSMFALMSAAMIRWFLPAIIDRIKQMIKEFKFSFIKKAEGGEK